MACCAGSTDNPSVNVVPTPDGKQLICMSEPVTASYRMDLDLNTLGPLKYQDRVEGVLTTAHPTLLPDRSMINLTSGVRYIRNSNKTIPLHMLLCRVCSGHMQINLDVV